MPKSHIYQLIRSGQVRVNKGRSQAETRLTLGDQIRIPPVRLGNKALTQTENLSRGSKQTAPAYRLPLFPVIPILFEDDYLLAIDKPAGLAVHGGSGVTLGVIEQLRAQRPQARFLELVHRLDKETSGILLVAKKRSALLALQDQLRQHQMQKRYLAVVVSTWPQAQQSICLPLHKYLLPHGERRVRVTQTTDPLGKSAITHVRRHTIWRSINPVMTGQTLTLLEVSIQTGRTHQIRVHLASQGHSILGDTKYGSSELNETLANSWSKTHAFTCPTSHFCTPTNTSTNNPDGRFTSRLATVLCCFIPRFF